jgi:hypothetical protein
MPVIIPEWAVNALNVVMTLIVVYLWRSEGRPLLQDFRASWDREQRLRGLALLVLREQAHRREGDEVATRIQAVIEEAETALMRKR